MNGPHQSLIKTNTLVAFAPLSANSYTEKVNVSKIKPDTDLISSRFSKSGPFNPPSSRFDISITHAPQTLFTTKLTKSYLSNGMKMINQYIKKLVIGTGTFGKAILVEDSRTSKRYVCFILLINQVFFTCICILLFFLI